MKYDTFYYIYLFNYHNYLFIYYNYLFIYYIYSFINLNRITMLLYYLLFYDCMYVLYAPAKGWSHIYGAL